MISNLTKQITTPDKNKHFIKTLTSRLKHGEYVNQIPPVFWNKFVSRKKSSYNWGIMTSAEKGTYLALEELLTRDDLTSDYHVGDDDFRNRVYGLADEWIQLGIDLFSEEYLADESIDFPNKMRKNMYTSSAHFVYAEYIGHSLKEYLPVKDAQDRRWNDDGTPKRIPLHPEAVKRYFKMFDCWSVGAKWMMSLPHAKQEELMLAAMPFGTNMGFPKFFKGTANNLPKTLLDLMVRTGFKPEGDKHPTQNRVCIHFKMLRQFRSYLVSKKIFFPFIGFSRISKEKIRLVCGDNVLGKWEAGMIKVCFEYAAYNYKHPDSFIDYEGTECDPDTGKKIEPVSHKITEVVKEEKVKTLEKSLEKSTGKIDNPTDNETPNTFEKKQLFGFGGLPLVAKLPWDDMFSMIMKRLPNRSCKVHINWVKTMFHYDVPSQFIVDGNYTYVNVIGGDFSGFDTGQIKPEYEDLIKHKYWGKFFSDILENLQNSPLWSGIVEFLRIFFKSGFFGTSDFGSFFHDGSAETVVRNLGGVLVAHICLSDDDLMWVLSNKIITAEMISEEYAKYGHTIKASASCDWSKNPILGFLKMHFGKIFKSEAIALIGDMQSRYYSLCHSERDTTDKTSSDLRNVWNITGEVETDRVLSKLGSGGPSSKPWVIFFLRRIRGTELGDKVRLAISSHSPNEKFRTYREDLDVTSYPPNWIFTIQLDSTE